MKEYVIVKRGGKQIVIPKNEIKTSDVMQQEGFQDIYEAQLELKNLRCQMKAEKSIEKRGKLITIVEALAS